MSESRRGIAMLCGVVVVAAIVRLALIPRQGLWADEIFSLAIATGHSLEQPPNQSRPELGDYSERVQPQPASVYRAYSQNDGGTTTARVMRAVLLSDTNPPLYYLLFHAWTLWFGTSDFSLRMFSVLWSLATLPLLFFIGRRVGDFQTGLIACLLFAIGPQALFYSTEGRMYSLTWFLITAYAYVILLLHDEGLKWDRVTLAILIGAGGLLTHYFFLFPWIACTGWLLIARGRTPRWTTIALLLITGFLVTPWYVRVPATMRAWRITGNWLYVRNMLWPRRTALFHLAWSYLTIEGNWHGSRRFDRLLLICVIGVVAAAFKSRGAQIFERRPMLLWVWMLAAIVAPIGFDLWRGSFTSIIERYASPGLPAAIMLLAFCLVSMPRTLRIAGVCTIVLIWTIGDRRIFMNESRDAEPFREVARQIDAQTESRDLLIVHAVPSGVVGIARYLHGNPDTFSWVMELHQRTVPADIARVAADRRKIVLVKIHYLGAPSPEEKWLVDHSRRDWARENENSHIHVFEFGTTVQGAIERSVR